jgi:hypothetical protein
MGKGMKWEGAIRKEGWTKGRRQGGRQEGKVGRGRGGGDGKERR